MSTHATLEPDRLELAPGDEQTCELTLLNSGRIVEEYRIAVLGQAASWITVEPETTNLYPGTQTTVTVRIHPQRTPPPPAGEIPFAVSAVPSGRTAETIAPEGTITVLPMTELTATVTPRHSLARRWAHHEVTVDNHGNAPVTASIHGTDPDGRLGFRLRPATVTVPPGEAWYARATVRHRRPLLLGVPVDRPFQLSVECPGQAPITMDAYATQAAIVPQPLLRMLSRLAVAVALAAVAWFALLKPVVSSTAKAEVAPVASVANQMAGIDAKLKAVESAAAAGAGAKAGAAASASATAAGGGVGPGSGPATAVPLSLGTPVGRDNDAKGEPVPDKTTLLITDMVVQNPHGDLGSIEILNQDQVLLTLSLANFRDAEYHYLTPIQVTAGKRLRLRVHCTAAGQDAVAGTVAPQCWEALLVSGGYQPQAAPSPSPSG